MGPEAPDAAKIGSSRQIGVARGGVAANNLEEHSGGDCTVTSRQTPGGTVTPEERQAYQRIQESVRQVIPFFAEFVLEPDNGHVLLQWRERGSEEIFAASQASDGMLRILALMTLLRQLKENLPTIMMLDEPELGLHPQAIMLLGALIRQASEHCQVIVATQSVALVDEFSIEDIVVLSRPGRESTLRRLSAVEYGAWLEEYTAGGREADARRSGTLD